MVAQSPSAFNDARVLSDPFEDVEEVKGGKEGLERNPRYPAPFVLALDEGPPCSGLIVAGPSAPVNRPSRLIEGG
jgi:hypothetical protein